MNATRYEAAANDLMVDLLSTLLRVLQNDASENPADM